LYLKGIAPEELLNICVSVSYQTYDISLEDFISYHKLPLHKNHKDLFDRLLIWQSIRNDLAFLTADKRIEDYSKYGLRLTR